MPHLKGGFDYAYNKEAREASTETSAEKKIIITREQFQQKLP